MNQPSPSNQPPSDLDQQALDWFARRERSLSTAEAAQFNAWLAANPAHGEAYARWHGDWARLDALPAAGIDQLRRQLAMDKADAAAPPSPARRHWLAALAPRAALATLALSASGGGILAWQHWRHLPVYEASFDTLRDLLGRALATERPVTLWGQASELQDDSWDLALTAKGLLDAARLLDGRYHFVVTNVPYLARGKQNDTLKDYCEAHYPEAKNDLANVFLERCLELSRDQGAGVVQIVMPQN